MARKEEIIEVTKETEIEITSVTVSSLIHIIRGKQVILDSDLAMLYQVETGAMNRAVKRNKKRFPEDFCFQLTEEEFLRCQNGISKDKGTDGARRQTIYAICLYGARYINAFRYTSERCGNKRQHRNNESLCGNAKIPCNKLSDTESCR